MSNAGSRKGLRPLRRTLMAKVAAALSTFTAASTRRARRGRRNVAASPQHHEASPVLAARFALEWARQFRRDPAAIEAARLRPNSRAVNAAIERARVECHARRQRLGALQGFDGAPLGKELVRYPTLAPSR